MNHLERAAAALRSERLSYSSLSDGSGVILDMNGLQVLTLNPTGAVLIDAIRSGVIDETNLVRRITSEFNVDEARAQADIASFLDQLQTCLGPL